jgi:hypothetical protein
MNMGKRRHDKTLLQSTTNMDIDTIEHNFRRSITQHDFLVFWRHWRALSALSLGFTRPALGLSGKLKRGQAWGSESRRKPMQAVQTIGDASVAR